MPADFRFPSPKTELWVPLRLEAHQRPGQLLGRQLHGADRALASGRDAGAGARGIEDDAADSAGGVRVADAGQFVCEFEHRFAGRSDRWRCAGEIADSARRGEFAAADRLRERSEPVAGARDNAGEGSGGARGAGSESLADSAATDDGERAAFAAGRRAGNRRGGGRALDSESDAACGHAAGSPMWHWMGRYWHSRRCWRF